MESLESIIVEYPFRERSQARPIPRLAGRRESTRVLHNKGEGNHASIRNVNRSCDGFGMRR